MTDDRKLTQETKDIEKSLQQYADNLDIDIHELDFVIEREEILEDSLGNLVANYMVSLFPLDKVNHQELLLFTSSFELKEITAVLHLKYIGLEKNLVTESHLIYTTDFIFKQLFKHRIIYGYISKSKLREYIKESLSELFDNNKSQDTVFSLEIAEGIEKTDGIDSKLTFFVSVDKMVGKISDSGVIDYKDIGTTERIIPENIKVASLSHAIKGEHGMDIHGKLMKARDGVELHKIKIETPDTLRAEEDVQTECIDFYSSAPGILGYNKQTHQMSLKPFIETNEISYKNIGSISSNTQRIDMFIKGRRGTLDDAIKEGFELYANHVKVTGNIGNNVKINCSSLVVEGKVNSGTTITSTGNITADNTYGVKIKGDIVHINTCMDCEIEANLVFVEKIATTEITAKAIVVTGNVKNCNLTAASAIVAGKTYRLENNEFRIDPLKLEEYRDKLTNLDTKLNAFQTQVKDLGKQIDKCEHNLFIIKKTITKDILRLNGIDYTRERETSMASLIENEQFDALKSRLKSNSALDKMMGNYSKTKKDSKQCASQLNIKNRALEKVSKDRDSLKNKYKKGMVLIGLQTGMGTKIIFQDEEKIAQRDYSEPVYFFFDLHNKKASLRLAEFSEISSVWDNIPEALAERFIEILPKNKPWKDLFTGII